ncbi:MAG TPA: ABC transporter substrate-binding protein [Solirubrobacterales bacterium]|nr:ABC transporter substrate-binding protein [Solirubrobacterales bacterium]
MKKLGTLLAALALVLVPSLLLVACGDDESDSGSSGGGAKGGEITISQTSQPDYLDPALSYTVNGWEPMWLVYTPLLAYPHEEGEAGSQLIPGLAEELPKVSADGKTYKLTLRKGLKYSDKTPVKASDFEHTIQRVLNLESGGAPFYEVIEGADKYLSGGDPEADISGITTNDKTGDITIKLTQPDSSFSYVLAMNFAGLVPGDTPFENLTKEPPPGVGPYMLTKSVPNREFVLEKNPVYAQEAIEDIPEGNIDTITTKIIKNQGQQSQDVIDNKLDYMQDPPSADFKAEVIERFGPDGSEEQRYEEFPTLSTYYMFMNTQEPPFDDPKVREAVNWGLDKPALARLFAGEATPGCTFLPPGMPGYNESLDTTDCPWGDPSQPPDLEKAKQMIKDAGADGAKVTVWGNNDDPTDKVTEAYTDQLNQMGFDAEPKIIDGGVYFQTIGNAKTHAQTGFLNWFADFPHPLNFYFLVDGDTIQPTNNQNPGNVDDPKINKEIDALSQETDLDAVTDRWEDLDRYLVESAYVVPYAHRKLATFVSERMDFENCTLVHPLYQNDYSSFCLKK